MALLVVCVRVSSGLLYIRLAWLSINASVIALLGRLCVSSWLPRDAGGLMCVAFDFG